MATEKTEFVFPDEVESAEKKGAAAAGADEGGENIEIVDDTPEADRGRVPSEPPQIPTDDELNKYDVGVRNRIKHISKGYHDERREKERAQREREEALRLAQIAVEENKRLKGSLNQRTGALVEQTKATVEAELAAAEREYREAYEAFDSEKLVAAQKKLNKAQIRAEQLENFQQSASQPEESVVQTTHQVAQQPAVDPKALAWREQNQWFGPDREMTSLALGLHDKLVNTERVDPRSDEYYARLNAEMRKRFPEKFEDTSGQQTPRPRTTNVAPATRSTAANKVTLTQSQVSIAKRLGVPLEAYAKQIALQQRNQNG